MGNDSEDLRRAGAMPEGGILFGADEEGNPLIANGGIGPVLTDRNYENTRKAVCFTKKDGRKVPTGYEMFNDEEEIRNFEDFTRRPFVQSPQDGEWRGSWLESGDDPGNWARGARPCSPGALVPTWTRRILCTGIPRTASGSC